MERSWCHQAFELTVLEVGRITNSFHWWRLAFLVMEHHHQPALDSDYGVWKQATLLSSNFSVIGPGDSGSCCFIPNLLFFLIEQRMDGCAPGYSSTRC